MAISSSGKRSAQELIAGGIESSGRFVNGVALRSAKRPMGLGS